MPGNAGETRSLSMPSVTVKCSIFRFSRCSIWLGGVGNEAVHSASLPYSWAWAHRVFCIRRTHCRGFLCQAKGARIELKLSLNVSRLRWFCFEGGSTPLCYRTLPSQPFSYSRWVAHPHPKASFSVWEHIPAPRLVCCQRNKETAASTVI